MFVEASERAMAWEALERRSTRRRHVGSRVLHHMHDGATAVREEN